MPGFIFQHVVQPRYAETDQGGRIHHSAYVPWIEEARIGFLHQQGVAYAQVEAAGYFLIVRHIELRYRRPIQFGSAVSIETRIEKQGHASLTFAYTLSQQDVLCAEAHTELACVDRQGKPTVLPENLKSALAKLS